MIKPVVLNLLSSLEELIRFKQEAIAKELAHRRLCAQISSGKKVTAKLLATETDPKRKRELVEAICLSKVR